MPARSRPTLAASYLTLFTVLCVCLPWRAPVARADTSAEKRGDGYGALVDEALRLYEQEDYPAALAHFERARAIRPNARVERGIALVWYELGDYARTIEAVDRALDNALDPLDQALRGQLMVVREQALAHMHVLRVRVQPLTATLWLDGQVAIANRSGELIVAPGGHVLEASAGGERSVLPIVAVEGSFSELTLTVREATQRDQPPRAAPVKKSVIIGLGTASLAGVGVTTLSALSWRRLNGELEQCRAAEAPGLACRNADEVNRARRGAMFGAIAGGALTLATTTWFALAVRSHRAHGREHALSCHTQGRGGSCSWTSRW